MVEGLGRILAGGVDGEYVSTRQADPSLTWAIVLRRVAQALANQIVENDLVQRDGSPILLDLSPSDRPGDPEFDRALETGFFRLMGERADEARLEGLVELWETLESIEGAEVAWQGVISAWLQDPDFVVY